MFRSLVVAIVIVCAIPSANVNAKGPGKGFKQNFGVKRGHYPRPGNYRSQYRSPGFGISVGIGGYPGYGYFGPGFIDPFFNDAYRSGRFKVPDLLNDPYFIEAHRYDSQFPGRRYQRAPLVIRQPVPAVSYPAYGSPTPYADVQTLQVDPADLPRELTVAAAQLTQSLSLRPGGEAWMECLKPHQISQFMAEGNLDELRKLLARFDSVYGYPELKVVTELKGFVTTRSLLEQYLNQPLELTEPRVDEPAKEPLPLPEPKELPEKLPLNLDAA